MHFFFGILSHEIQYRRRPKTSVLVPESLEEILDDTVRLNKKSIWLIKVRR